jgi:hypothetical protein
MTATETRLGAVRGTVDGTLSERKVRPVKAWALVGVIFLAVEFWAVGAWLLSGDAKRTPSGPTPVPGWMEASAQLWTVLTVAGMCCFLYFFLIRPWRRQGGITLDGMLCITFLFLSLQDPILNYFQVWYTYSAVFFNLGNWAHHFPGWLSPRGEVFAEPILWAAPTYITVLLAWVMICCEVMRKAKGRWPRMGKFGLLGICFGLVFTFDVMLEPLHLRLGFYSYPGAISWLTLNHGHYYQYPLYEGFFVACLCTAWAAIRFFRDDKGYTLAERGIDDVRASGKKKTALRFLGLMGACQVALFLMYNGPLMLLSLYSSPWPADIQNRSYLTNGLCGTGSGYACPGPEIPINRPDSAHLDPNGRLVVPQGTTVRAP